MSKTTQRKNGIMEWWERKVERWKNGMMEDWNSGRTNQNPKMECYDTWVNGKL